ALEARYGGVAIEMAGAVGSVETPKVFTGGTVTANPTGMSDPGHPAGCRTIFSTTGTPVPLGYFQETRAVGEGVANQVIAALDSSARTSSSNVIRFDRTTFFVPIDNALFIGAGLGQVFPRRPFYVNGVEVPQASAVAADPTSVGGTDTPAPDANGFEAKTSLVAFQIGDGEFISTPGEQFPIGYIRGFQGPQDMPYPNDPISAWVTPHMTGQYRFIEGLGEDMIGYLFPKANAVGVPGDRPVDDPTADSGDRFGCGHSDDSEATSGDAGDIVSQHAVDVLTKLGQSPDQILVGRYLWPDGTLHRSPLGDGTLGCDDATRDFTAAPGTALGVVVQQNGTTVTYALRGSNVAGAVPVASFIDYNGNA